MTIRHFNCKGFHVLDVLLFPILLQHVPNVFLSFQIQFLFLFVAETIFETSLTINPATHVCSWSQTLDLFVFILQFFSWSVLQMVANKITDIDKVKQFIFQSKCFLTISYFKLNIVLFSFLIIQLFYKVEQQRHVKALKRITISTCL
jgi:hypothetical protein